MPRKYHAYQNELGVHKNLRSIINTASIFSRGIQNRCKFGVFTPFHVPAQELLEVVVAGSRGGVARSNLIRDIGQFSTKNPR